MEWLNLHVRTLDSPEMVASSLVERAIWLALLRYCIGQENLGTIKNCRGWTNSHWSHAVGIPARQVKQQSALWTWRKNNLVVRFYPKDSQKEVQAKREGGRIGANKRWGKNVSDGHGSPIGSGCHSANGERNGIKEKGKEQAQEAIHPSSTQFDSVENQEIWLSRMRKEWPNIDVDHQLSMAERTQRKKGGQLERRWFEEHWLPNCSPTVTRAAAPCSGSGDIDREPENWRELILAKNPTCGFAHEELVNKAWLDHPERIRKMILDEIGKPTKP